MLSFGSANALNLGTVGAMAAIVTVVRNNLDRAVPVSLRRLGPSGNHAPVCCCIGSERWVDVHVCRAAQALSWSMWSCHPRTVARLGE